MLLAPVDPESKKVAQPTNPPKPEPSDPAVAEVEELSELKELLIDADGISQVLSQAVSISTASDDQLARALRPTIEQSLEESTRRNPGMLAEAIFPILGPAIRRSINETFDSLVQSLQTTLEHSMSSQGWKWRFEAWRTGRPFAEVVLSHTLLYKVEAVFLIHSESGVLLHHAASMAGVVKDEDMVSGMLTAIQDFVGDSFEGTRNDRLRTMQVGERSVWIENSPRLTLAAVISGRAPVEYRGELRSTLEQVELGYAKPLKSFSGDVAVFSGTEPLLENCLKSESAVKEKSGGSPMAAYAVLVILLLVLAVFLGFRWYESARWDDVVSELRSESGIVVLDARHDGDVPTVIGMRDSFSRDPLEVLRSHGYAKHEVRMKWEPYVSHDPELLVRRAREKLKAPESIKLHFQGGMLTALGKTDESWFDLARVKAVWIPGVDSFRRENEQRADTSGVAIRYVHDTVLELQEEFQLKEGQEARFAGLVQAIKTVLRPAADGEVNRSIIIRGHGETGYQVVQSFTSAVLAAEVIREVLIERGIDGRHLTVKKAGFEKKATGSGVVKNSTRKLTVSFVVVDSIPR